MIGSTFDHAAMHAPPDFTHGGADATRQPSAPSPLLGLLMLAMAGLLALAIVVGGLPSPGPDPDPRPRPDVVIDDSSETAEIAGRLEDRLYADVFEQLADETEAGKYETVAAWSKVAKQRLFDARASAHEPLHQTLNDFFPSGTIDDSAAFAELQREFAKGFRRSGK